MVRRIKYGLGLLLDRYVAAAVLLTLPPLTLLGVGDVAAVSLLGLLLCGMGLAQPRFAQVDPWLLGSLFVYVLACMASSLRVYGDISEGYGVLHAVFPLLCLLSACVEERDRRLLRDGCLLWTGAVGALGVLQYVFQAVTQGRVGRMSGLLGNPNAMGIFLVLGWTLTADRGEGPNEESRWPLLEPLLLMSAAMTLSMGSFLAMAAGVAALLWERRRTASRRETVWYACRILAKAGLGMGTGLLIYLAAARTGTPWACLLPLLYGVALMALWRNLERFLEARPRMAALMAGLGLLVALAAVAARPSAVSTFAERLEMMGSGLHYLTADPLFGVGAFQWRLLDRYDGGKYFNTWHIHNIPLHVGVEMGWLAMASLLLAGLRMLTRRQAPAERALMAAFLLHSLIDTSFFYLGITALVLTATGGPREGGRRLSGRGTKLLFVLLALPFAWGLYHMLVPG